MARSKESFNKREKEKQRQKEKREKQDKMAERRAQQGKGNSLNDMLAYVDENGNITSTPPDPQKRIQVNAEEIEIGVPKQEPENAQKEGIVEYFNEGKGFGFIMQNDGKKIFFHINQASYPVKEGDALSYNVERGPKGWSAVNITRRS
jgi:cold shock CspA family protein